MAVNSVEEFDKAIKEINNTIVVVREDVEKAKKGNKAAATRVRKQLQAIKNAAQIGRVSILEVVKSKAA